VNGDPHPAIDLDRPGDGLQDALEPAATALAAHAASTFGGAALAVLHYGSRAQGRATRPDSAFDFFVVVTTYEAAYRAAAAVLGPRCRPRLGVALAHVLPPNAISIRRAGPASGEEAKCLVISEHDFRRECSARARDHFVQARVAQTVRLAWSRDEAVARLILAAVRNARTRTFEWARAFLPRAFDLPGYCRTLIAVSFKHELRAEPTGHAEVLFATQRSLLLAIYGPVLAGHAAHGALDRTGGEWRQRHLPGRWTRWRVRTWFRLSRVRTTARLLKHPFLYDDWLDYLTRKIHRSTGQRVTLTPRERRHPLVFLWPRVFRYLRHRPQRTR
jgi:hypothetical protein